MSGARPNIMVIHAHDLGRHSTAYGWATPTPSIERFSRTATLFTNAWSCAPTCSPSRAALLTGRYPHDVGMLGLAHLGFSLRDVDAHLSRALAAVGYRTYLSGVQHEVPDHRTLGYRAILGEDPQAPYGDRFDPLPWDRRNTDAVCRFLRRDSGSTPWFLFFGLYGPHRPFQTHADIDADRLFVPPGLPSTVEVRNDYADFVASVGTADAHIGRVLDATNRSGRDADTVIIITSDHGIDFPRYKCTLSGGGLGVHLIIRLPGQAAGIVVREPVSTIDLVPTLFDILGRSGDTDEHRPWDGRSLLPLWDSPTRSVRGFSFAESNYHVAYDPARSIFDGRYHYVEHYESSQPVLANVGDSPSKEAVYRDPAALESLVPPRTALYDLWSDPLQNRNVVGERYARETRDTLEETLRRWMASTGDPLLDGPIPAPAGAAVADRSAYSSTSADSMRRTDGRARGGAE